jgi:hypothetical protein
LPFIGIGCGILKKIYLALLSLSLIISVSGQGTFDIDVSSYSYSADLKAGDQFAWTVTGASDLVAAYLPSGSAISLKVLKDLAGESFPGDINATAISEYFEVDFGGTFDYEDDLDLANMLVFPTEIVFNNGTKINPIKGYWVYGALAMFDFPEEDIDVSLSITESGDYVTFSSEVTVSENFIDSTSASNATINQKTGILKEFEFEVEVFNTIQKLRVTQTDGVNTSETSETSKSSEESTGDDVPLNSLWLASLILIPIARKIKK